MTVIVSFFRLNKVLSSRQSDADILTETQRGPTCNRDGEATKSSTKENSLTRMVTLLSYLATETFIKSSCDGVLSVATLSNTHTLKIK